MQSLKEMGLADYYYLDNDKIYNSKRDIYMKPCGEYRYKLIDAEGKQRYVTMKEIYRKLFDKVFCIDEIERLNGEEFREIKGTNGNYLISNKARVISYMSNFAIVMKTFISEKGYERIQLVINGVRCNKFIHQLVAREFLELPKDINPLDIEIHHLKGKRENDVDSIIYISKEEHHKLHKRKKENIECQSFAETQTKEA